jgi:cobalt-zinc-cadmium efflux system protein
VRTHFPVAFEHATIQMESPEVHAREAARSLHA